MTTLLLAVLAQTRYVCAVHSFVRELLLVTVPDLVKDSAHIRTDTEFSNRIDRAISDVSLPEATEADYVRAIVDAACREMSDVCRVLKTACGLAGFDKLAAEYLDAERFKEILVRRNAEKLERVKAIVHERNGKPVKILMDVAAALNDRDESYADMAAKEKRKAAADLDKVVGKVSDIVAGAETRLAKKIDKGNSDVVERVDEVGRKVDLIKTKGRRRSKYGKDAVAASLVFWEAAHRNATLCTSLNGSLSRDAAYAYYSRDLARNGVTSVKMFKAILHAAQNREYVERKKELEDRGALLAERKPDSKTRKPAKPKTR